MIAGREPDGDRIARRPAPLVHGSPPLPRASRAADALLRRDQLLRDQGPHHGM